MDYRKVDFVDLTEAEAGPARIISDPGMAIIRDSDGKVVPIVQLDATDRSDIGALFAAHSPEVIGEAATQWGIRNGAAEGTVTLFLQFHTPARLLIFMDFDVAHQGVLVDEIVRAEELYIQAIRRVTGEVAPAGPSRIRVTVPDAGFRTIWNEIKRRATNTKRF